MDCAGGLAMSVGRGAQPEELWTPCQGAQTPQVSGGGMSGKV